MALVQIPTPTAASGGMTLIATSTPTSGSAVSFSSIASTYKHLLVTWSSLRGNYDGSLNVTFNDNTGNNYSRQYFGNSNNSAGVGSIAGTDKVQFVNALTNATDNSYKSRGYFYIYNYSSTDNNFDVEGVNSCIFGTGAFYSFYVSGQYNVTTTAINKITITSPSGDFAAGVIRLFGVS